MRKMSCFEWLCWIAAVAIIVLLMITQTPGQQPAKDQNGLFVLPQAQQQVAQRQAATRLDVAWFDRNAEVEVHVQVRSGMTMVIKYPKGAKVESIAAHLMLLDEQLDKYLPREKK